ncbi:hypothetical protein MA16_Dca028408 [Dendrobium catenatum]|uniref:Uncharacterized protein n=1 Tax=Dendrobium catenatum TaxID=906689 RepID=A0A2I0VC10_9ASPA|nr:hypothetical protein MA16_Dca028408 [Dendrobium catenatum]
MSSGKVDSDFITDPFHHVELVQQLVGTRQVSASATSAGFQDLANPAGDLISATPTADQVPAPPAPVSGESALWQGLSGNLTSGCDSDRDEKTDPSCPEAPLADYIGKSGEQTITLKREVVGKNIQATVYVNVDEEGMSQDDVNDSEVDQEMFENDDEDEGKVFRWSPDPGGTISFVLPLPPEMPLSSSDTSSEEQYHAGIESDCRQTEFIILSGTSMACPHVPAWIHDALPSTAPRGQSLPPQLCLGNRGALVETESPCFQLKHHIISRRSPVLTPIHSDHGLLVQTTRKGAAHPDLLVQTTRLEQETRRLSLILSYQASVGEHGRQVIAENASIERHQVVAIPRQPTFLHCAHTMANDDNLKGYEFLKQIRQHSSPHGNASLKAYQIYIAETPTAPATPAPVSGDSVCKEGGSAQFLRIMGSEEVPYLDDENAGEDPELKILIRNGDGGGPIDSMIKGAFIDKEKLVILDKIRSYVQDMSNGEPDVNRWKRFTHSYARIIKEIGGQFSLIDGSITWANEELQEGKLSMPKFDKLPAEISTSLHLLGSTKEQQHELYKACEAGFVPRNDLISFHSNDKDFVMQWLRNPSYDCPGTDWYRNISLLAIVGHGNKEKTTLLQYVYKDEEEERIQTKGENVLPSLSYGIWKSDLSFAVDFRRDRLYAKNSYPPPNWQIEMLFQFKDPKVEPPHLDWGKPLHIVLLKSTFKVFDPGICLPPYIVHPFYLTSLERSRALLRKGRMMRSTLA